MAHLVLPDGDTIGQKYADNYAMLAEKGQLHIPLLTGPVMRGEE